MRAKARNNLKCIERMPLKAPIAAGGQALPKKVATQHLRLAQMRDRRSYGILNEVLIFFSYHNSPFYCVYTTIEIRLL